MADTSLQELLTQGSEVILGLEPEELALPLLKALVLREPQKGAGPLSRHTFFNDLHHGAQPEGVLRALMEAWIWLEQEGLVAPKPLARGSEVFVTRRGLRLAESGDTSAYKHAGLLPKKLLHPVIAQKVWSVFISGDYDTAVFVAFKQVEVAVRRAAGRPDTDIGVSLMRDAFNPDKGPLKDKAAPVAERQALSDLFAGAIGSYKNPHSHRNVPLDRGQAVEMIMLASHLMKIVDARSPASATEAPSP